MHRRPHARRLLPCLLRLSGQRQRTEHHRSRPAFPAGTGHPDPRPRHHHRRLQPFLRSCRIAWREDGTVSASDFPVLSFGEGVYYAASAFAQQEREIVPGQPLPLLLLVGNQEGSATTAAVPSDFYNNPEAIGGDEVQMIAVTFSE